MLPDRVFMAGASEFGQCYAQLKIQIDFEYLPVYRKLGYAEYVINS